MVFLPIVERELRVAARKPSAVWLRVLAGLIPVIIGAGFLAMGSVIGGGPLRSGVALFYTLTWLAMVAALAAGLFFTADSLSEEKREGTLGFLFLTDLCGYDIVGGKLLATSWRGACALLAIFPILAVTLVMGGVTGIQFCKSVLALINTLFFSLAAGLFVSSFCRDSQRAMGTTLFLLLAVSAGGPLVDVMMRAWRPLGFRPVLSFASPVYVFQSASAWGRNNFWTGLLASHLLGWVWFILACLLIPHAWQDPTGRISSVRRFSSYSWKLGAAPSRVARRRRLLEPNPVLWLVLRERWQWIPVWGLVLLVLVPFLAISWSSMVWIIVAQVSWLVLVILYLWTASQSSRFFVEARRTGLMELLLVTPLSGKDIVLGQWQSLTRMIGLPAFLLLAVQCAGSSLSQHAMLGTLAANGSSYAPSLVVNLASAALGGLSMIANLVALAWFGMWMGLTSKNASMATLKTVVLVQVLPWFGITFASTTIMGLLMLHRVMAGGATSNSMVLSFPLVMTGLSAVLSVAKDAAFFFWSRDRLYASFRAAAALVPGAVMAGGVLTRA